MALLHRARLQPTKLELLAAWLPSRGWYQGPAGAEIERVDSYRFDDPAGAVGIETMIVRPSGGPIYQVPLTYRDAPLDGSDAWLVGTCEHSVLGQRWVYDACADPVYVAALVNAIVGATGQAEEFVESDGRLEQRERTMTVTGSGVPGAELPAVRTVRRITDGDPAIVDVDAAEFTVVRVLDGSASAAGPTLTGTWAGQPTPLLLAAAQLRATV